MPRTQPQAAPAAPKNAALSPEGIAQLVHGFYGDVRADPLLGPVFEEALHGQWDAHLQRLIAFWSTVALGTRSFKGDVFGKHMALDGVTPAHFAAWVRLWQLHTSQLFAPEVAEQLQQAAHGIARNLFRGYFGQAPSFDAPQPAGSESDSHGTAPAGQA